MILRASAIFTTWVWVVMMRDAIVGNHLSTSFRLIHVGIGLASIAFAVVTWVIAGSARRFTRSVERERRPPPPEKKSVAHRAGASLGRRARVSPPGHVPDGSMPNSIPVSGSMPIAGSGPLDLPD